MILFSVCACDLCMTSDIKYYGKLVYRNIHMEARMTSELAHAIDARIALLQIEAIVDQRDENWQAFEEIMRLAVVEVRSLEQNSICLLQFVRF